MLAHTQWHSLHCRSLQRVARTEGRVALLPFCKQTHTHTHLLSCVWVCMSVSVCQHTVKAQNLRSVFKFCGIKFLISFFQKDQEKVSQTLSVSKRERAGEGTKEREGMIWIQKISIHIIYSMYRTVNNWWMETFFKSFNITYNIIISCHKVPTVYMYVPCTVCVCTRNPACAPLYSILMRFCAALLACLSCIFINCI